MDSPEIIDLYQSASPDKKKSFKENLNTKLNVDVDFQKFVKDVDWIDMFSNTIQYIDNIYRNPNRFIINEEEIVKIEMARKITVESIKHLTRNTNFIQEIDKKTGDVKPSKILNINKEDSYDTYENRLIYTLIQNMKFFLNKKRMIIENLKEDNEKDCKKIKYEGSTNVFNKKLDVDLTITATSDLKSSNKENSKEQILNRITRLESDINMLTFSDVYKVIDKKHITLITPPIKKTNVILKNVNFQYAMKLWDYLQNNMDDKTKLIADKASYQENGEMKSLMDDTFFLQSIILDDREAMTQEDKVKQKEVVNIITDKIIEKMINLNSDLTENQFKKLINEKFAVIKFQETVTINEINRIFKEHINKYLKQVKGAEYVRKNEK